MSTFNANLFFNNPNLSLVYTEDPFNEQFVKGLSNKVFIFHQFTWNIEASLSSFPWDYHYRFSQWNPNFNFKENFIFCAPNEYVKEEIEKKGYSVILLNLNSLVDYNLFNIGNVEKIYDFVINARPFKWKRVYLAAELSKLAYIKGYDWAQNDTTWTGEDELQDATIFSHIHQSEVSRILNQSRVGLILSGNTGGDQQGLNEGANYATIEYLYSGLPVITTPNQGGRNFWLNSDNSLVCEPSIEAVNSNSKNALLMLERNDFNSHLIRAQAILTAHKLRLNFIERVNSLITRHGLNFDFKNEFTKLFFNKFTTYKVDINELLTKINS